MLGWCFVLGPSDMIVGLGRIALEGQRTSHKGQNENVFVINIAINCKSVFVPEFINYRTLNILV